MLQLLVSRAPELRPPDGTGRPEKIRNSREREREREIYQYREVATAATLQRLERTTLPVSEVGLAWLTVTSRQIKET